jgi:hypothetical protein
MNALIRTGPVTTTLAKIRAHKPCSVSWAKLRKHLGKTKADDEPLPLVSILASNGLDDALWCLRACDDIDREARLFGVWCARQVEHLMIDPRSVAALDVAERYADGMATSIEMAAAWSAAEDAAEAAAWAAAKDAAVAAAKAAAWSAAEDAASDAAWDAARDAARAAAWAAARDAAKDAAKHAAWAAAKHAAWAAAWDAARAAQETEFHRMFGGAQ